MSNVEGAYCAEDDMRTGDVESPSYTSKTQYVKNASEEIDIALGHLYVTPFLIDDSIPANRPSILFLKKLNWLLASGRFMLDVAAAGEMDNTHAYGRHMLAEAKVMIKQAVDKDFDLIGAEFISDDEADIVTGPTIHNEDPESLVESFYKPRTLGYPYTTSRPYGHTPNPLEVFRRTY